MARLAPGDVFGGFRVDDTIGRGGMGVVYRALQTRLNRPVALKVIKPELAEDPSFRARFDREVTMAAAIDHPNIVPVYEAGDVDGVPYLAMRYVPGTDLGALLSSNGALALPLISQVAMDLGSALDAAHHAGLVHRDIKPANVLLGSSGHDDSYHLYLTDFGLTKSRDGSMLTKPNTWVGTIPYISPEQIQGRVLDGRSDIYSFSCVLYECLTGDVPFDRPSDLAIIYAHLQDERPRPCALRSELPPRVDEVITRGMARERGDRYGSATELARALRDALAMPSPEAPPTPRQIDPDGETRVSPAPAPAPRPSPLPAPAPAPPREPAAAPVVAAASAGPVAPAQPSLAATTVKPPYAGPETTVPQPWYGPGQAQPPPAAPAPTGPAAEAGTVGRRPLLLGAAAGAAMVLLATILIYLLSLVPSHTLQFATGVRAFDEPLTTQARLIRSVTNTWDTTSDISFSSGSSSVHASSSGADGFPLVICLLVVTVVGLVVRRLVGPGWRPRLAALVVAALVTAVILSLFALVSAYDTHSPGTVHYSLPAGRYFLSGLLSVLVIGSFSFGLVASMPAAVARALRAGLLAFTIPAAIVGLAAPLVGVTASRTGSGPNVPRLAYFSWWAGDAAASWLPAAALSAVHADGSLGESPLVNGGETTLPHLQQHIASSRHPQRLLGLARGGGGLWYALLVTPLLALAIWALAATLASRSAVTVRDGSRAGAIVGATGAVLVVWLAYLTFNVNHYDASDQGRLVSSFGADVVGSLQTAVELIAVCAAAGALYARMRRSAART